MNKTIAMLIALLCLMAQGAWAEDVSYIYYTVTSDGKTVTKHTDGTASNPTAITSSTRKLDAANTERWYVVNSNVTIMTKERLDCYGTVNIIHDIVYTFIHVLDTSLNYYLPFKLCCLIITCHTGKFLYKFS